MARLPAARALGLAVAGALLTTGGATQAGAVDGAAPDPTRPERTGPLVLPHDRATDPMPRLPPRDVPPVPLPHVHRPGPGPVPMPEARAGRLADVLPPDLLGPDLLGPDLLRPGRSGAAPRPVR